MDNIELERPQTILESEIYQNPNQAFNEEITKLKGLMAPEVQDFFDNYIEKINSLESKESIHQDNIHLILNHLINNGHRAAAGLLFNIHRFLTHYSGYDPNKEKSSDVQACFGAEIEEGEVREKHKTTDIPSDGLIVVDLFVTRNLPDIVKICKEKGVDLSRIRVRVPKGVLAAQFMQLSEDKKAAFQETCSELNADQFLTGDGETNPLDIELDEKIGVLFSPRTLPIYPEIHEKNEKETIKKYRKIVKDLVNQTITGGRLFLDFAKVEEFTELKAEKVQKRRLLTKLTQSLSINVRNEIFDVLEDNCNVLRGDEFAPMPQNDHGKSIQALHVKKIGILKRSYRKIGKFFKKRFSIFEREKAETEEDSS